MRPTACVSSVVDNRRPSPSDERFRPSFRAARVRSWIRLSRSASRITLDPEESATINIVSGVGETRDVCLSLVEKYQDRRLADRVFDLAWTHSQVVLRQLNATEADAQLYGRLARLGHLRQCLTARRSEAAHQEPPRAIRVSGATPFPAICPSCSYKLEMPPISIWCANSFRPMPTGA